MADAELPTVFAELSTPMSELVPLAAGFHPEMVPSSVAKMNRAAPFGTPVAAFFGTTNPVVPLATCPVGVAASLLPGGGAMVTTNPCFMPAALYSVVLPVPLSLTQIGLVAVCDMPHAFTSNGSVLIATPGTSDTRLVWT